MGFKIEMLIQEALGMYIYPGFVYCHQDFAIFLLVQAFYLQKWVNLPLIAKQCFLTDFSPGTCPL